MSDAQTVWKLGLALACAWGAWTMKVAGSGVSDDGKADDVRNSVDGRGSSVRLRSNSGVAEVHAMKEQDEHRGQVIDFPTARDRILMRRWAVAHGFARVRS